MKRFGWIIAIALATMLTACAPKTENKVVTSKQVVEQAQKAVETLQTYLQEQGALHQQGAEAKLARFDRRIAIIKAKADKMESQAKAKLQKQLAAFAGKEEALKQNLAKMKSQKTDDFEKTIAGIAIAMNDLENEFDKLLENL